MNATVSEWVAKAEGDWLYPGESADQQDGTEAFEIATRMRAKLLPFFGLSP
jgi:hypothetical protein